MSGAKAKAAASPAVSSGCAMFETTVERMALEPMRTCCAETTRPVRNSAAPPATAPINVSDLTASSDRPMPESA